MINVSAFAQTPAYDISKDPKNGEITFRGPVTFEDLEKEPTFTWLTTGRDEYKPDENKVKFIREKIAAGNYTFVVFLGTWCSDSHDLVPRFRKVLELIKFPLTKVTMYGTDREKTTKNGEEKQYRVTLVPTIILFENDKESGRITETVQKSIEDDIASFFPD